MYSWAGWWPLRRYFLPGTRLCPWAGAGAGEGSAGGASVKATQLTKFPAWPAFRWPLVCIFGSQPAALSLSRSRFLL
jgi:hypothetical protein